MQAEPLCNQTLNLVRIDHHCVPYAPVHESMRIARLECLEFLLLLQLDLVHTLLRLPTHVLLLCSKGGQALLLLRCFHFNQHRNKSCFLFGEST
jgi:hypothetical protein